MVFRGIDRMRMLMPVNQENLRSRISNAPDGSSTASLTNCLSVRLTLNCPGEGPPIKKPIRLPSASKPPSDIAISVPASGWPFMSLGTNTSASSPLL